MPHCSTALQGQRRCGYCINCHACCVLLLKAFKCFTTKNAAESQEAIAKRIAASDVTEEAKSLLHSFLPLRQKILRTIAKQAAGSAVGTAVAGEEMQQQAAHEGSKLLAEDLADSAAAHVPPVISPLMQLIRMHSYLRLQLRPQQRAPSLAEWQRQQQQRIAQRKSPHKTNSAVPHATDEDPTNVSMHACKLIWTYLDRDMLHASAVC